MANEQYGVDLDALDQVVKELNHVLARMGGPCSKAEGRTYIPDGALGKGFSEADELYAAHGEMKNYIEKHILGLIKNFIDDFGTRTRKTKEHYDDAEHDNTMTYNAK